MATRQITWIGADGVEFPFSSSNNINIIQSGLKGFMMPPVEYTEDEIPYTEGTILRSIKFKARELDIPIKVSCNSNTDFTSKMRLLLRSFNPLTADGKIRTTSFDGTQREINCRYVSGFEMDEANAGDSWMKAIGIFRAFNPYWQDVATTTQTFTLGQPASFFPLFPLRLASSTVFTDTTIDNIGDVETWPEWIIYGPCDSIYLRNLTSNELINVNLSLQSGESVIINTKKGFKTVKKNDGTNLYSYLSDDSSLWSLQKGKNNIRIEMANATTDSSVQLSYQNRYLGAW